MPGIIIVPKGKVRKTDCPEIVQCVGIYLEANEHPVNEDGYTF